MNNQLEFLKNILINFRSDMKKKEELWLSIGHRIAGNVGFEEEIHPWGRKEACCWMFLDVCDHFRKLDLSVPTVDVALESAYSHYCEWLGLNLEVQNHQKYILEPPYIEETISVHLERVSYELRRDRYCKSIKWRSFRSFIAYLRAIFLIDQRGCIEELFPKRMRIFSGKVAKIVPPTAYPIDIYTTAAILKNLAQEVIQGRSNVQLSAAETLGFILVCLTCARRRLPTQLKLVSQIPKDCLAYHRSPENSKKQPWLMVPTYYGLSPVPISLTLFKYLEAISNIQSNGRKFLFQSHPRSLLRVLDRIVGDMPSTEKLGKITLLTFLSRPEEVINQR